MHVSRLFCILPLALSLAACDGGIDDEEAARVAYLGIDRGVDRAMKLGFDGFNAASSANIPEQSEPGALSGTMTVGGQVDQGSSNNKEMRLLVALSLYSDSLVEEEHELYYDTQAALALDMSLKGLPDADLTGSMVGDVYVSGDLEGPLHLNLSITGKTEENTAGDIQRAPGTTRISGTAQNEEGVYNVDVTR